MKKKQQSLVHNHLKLLYDIVLKALSAKSFESRLKNSDEMEVRKRLWLLDFICH